MENTPTQEHQHQQNDNMDNLLNEKLESQQNDNIDNILTYPNMTAE